MELLIQPGAGASALLNAIHSAAQSIEIIIFRFDRRDIESALESAAARGVFVHALVTYTNRGGEKSLRKLEMRLLESGVTVARTAADLARYHDKLVIIDRRRLFLLTFNFTSLDIDHSRSFGIVTEDRHLVQEAVKLFEADTTRQPYTAGHDSFIVSPVNARRELAQFISGARRQLLIYDPKVSDGPMIGLLQERIKEGVDVRVIGRTGRVGREIATRKLSRLRLHTRTMIRDGELAFLGSQSLRGAELDARREVGIVVNDSTVVSALTTTFESDWVAAEPSETPQKETKTLKKAVKGVLKDLPPLAPVVSEVFQEILRERGQAKLSPGVVEEAVREAVKDAVTDGIKDAIKETLVGVGQEG